MNRKDIIIISVLINAALLAVLFITATHPEDEGPARPQPVRTAMNDPSPRQVEPEALPLLPQPEIEPYLTEAQPPMDEVDHMLRDYVPEESLPLENRPDQSLLPDQPPETPKQSPQLPPQNYVEMTVKKGDVLEKIARANGTTVQAIKEANKMSTDRLRIGQVLRIPASSGDAKTAEASRPMQTAPQTSADSDPVYYIVKSGDNPWKIAKQFGVNFEDILKLNNMSEEQARRLKVGDKIRVK